MRLAAKITLAMVALLGLLFAVGGAVMVRQSFYRGYENAVAAAGESHARQKEALRRQLVERQYAEGYLPNGGLELAAQNSSLPSVCLALLTGVGTVVYNELPDSFSREVCAGLMETPQPGYRLYRFEEGYFLAVPSFITAAGQELYVITATDVTPVFYERQRQTATFLAIYAGILVLASALVALVVHLITRPLKRLGTQSGQIAAGSYATRIQSRRQDEIGELARNFDEMAAAVEEKVKSLEMGVKQREDFMGAFTHELKTPMTAMMGYAALLKRGGMPEEKRQRALDYIHSETRRLEVLSQKMLMLLGLSEESIEPEPVSLAQVLKTVQSSALPTGDCRLELPDAQGLWVLGDGDLLADLLLNLVRNAVNAQPADGCVYLHLAQNGQGVTLSVQDKGSGIPPEELARIQEPFYRVDKSRAGKQGGTGLGLAICGRIAALHGTRLEFASRPGEGTTVGITLPLAREEGL